jgi:hypothetical protein
MGIFQKAKLLQMGGLTDVSGDGKGLYCEYMLLLRASQFPYVQYVNFPLVLYRHHAEAWGVKSTDAAMFQRGAENFNKKSLEILTGDRYRQGFFLNYSAVLKLITGNYVSALRRKGALSLRSLISYLYSTRKYLYPLNGKTYFLGTLALLNAGCRLLLRESWYRIKGLK